MQGYERKPQIGIVGSAGREEYSRGGGATAKMNRYAFEIGKMVAERGAVLITGGKGGIMEAASQGAKKEGGITVGIVSSGIRFGSNQFIDVEILTGMTSAGLDELFLVFASDALIVLGGGAGTLQEMAIAYRNNKPIIALDGVKGWGTRLRGKYLDERRIMRITRARTSEEAVRLAFSLAKKNKKMKPSK